MRDVMLDQAVNKGIADILRRINALERNDYYRPTVVRKSGISFSIPPTRIQLVSVLGQPSIYNGNILALVALDTQSFIVFGDGSEYYSVEAMLAV